jgi:hypothetical protein
VPKINKLGHLPGVGNEFVIAAGEISIVASSSARRSLRSPTETVG